MSTSGLSRIQWPFGFVILALATVPAWTGWGLGPQSGTVITGVSWGWVLYFVSVHLLIALFVERRWYANILTIAAWVTLPVVYVGAAITWLGMVVGWVDTPPSIYGIHYVRLCITMLTVVPLALALVTVIPFSRMERGLLMRPQGITLMQKKWLMILRVFNHTTFFVIPGLLEVLREERSLLSQYLAADVAEPRKWRRWGQFRALLRVITYLAVESICAAVQFIPLWAYEIDRLPERSRINTPHPE